MVLLYLYLLSLQSKIIANDVQGCTNLTVLDIAIFFYQYHLHLDYCIIFIVITYCGQETFQVPIMEYINQVAYVQQKIDNILRNARAWVCAYIDEIICGTKSLLDLLEKLHILFNNFLDY